MNDEINRLLARIEALENAGVSDDIKAKIDIINRLTLPPSITKQCDCKIDIESVQTQLDELSKLSEGLKSAKFDAFAFDSARRTFGEELSIFASSINKRLDKLEKAVDNNG